MEVEGSTYTPSLEELLPGGMSDAGFLNPGQTLEEVLRRDGEALKILGYKVREIVDLLAPVTEIAAIVRSNFVYEAPNGKTFEVVVKTWRGSQKCPWHDWVDWRKSDGSIDIYLTEVTEEGKRGEVVRIPGLLRHLVENHGFFEGGEYRVAPERIVRMFGTERNPGSLERVGKLEF